MQHTATAAREASTLARSAAEREAGEHFGDYLHRAGIVALPPYPTHTRIALELVP